MTSLKKISCLFVTISFYTSVLAQHSDTRQTVLIDTLDKVVTTKDTAKLDEVAVLGYTSTQLANRQAYNITAIDAKKLHNSTMDIAHVLDRIPGARLRQTGGVGSDFDLSINGFSGKRIKYFVDGVPMDDLGSAFQINNIPVNMAERIEIYKGVIPVWLGSDILGAAVNIITPDRQNYVDVSYSYGSFNTHRSHINTTYTSKNGFQLQLNAFQNYSDNDYTMTVDAADIHTGENFLNSRVKRFHDRYHNETAIVNIGVVDRPWADKLLAGVTLGQVYKEIQTGTRLIAVFGNWHTKGNIVTPSLRYEKKDALTEGLDVRLHASYNLGEEQSIDTVHARYGWLSDSIRYSGPGGERAYTHYVFRNLTGRTTASLSYRIDDRQSLMFNHVMHHFDRRGKDLKFPGAKRFDIPQKTNKHTMGFGYQYGIADKWAITSFAKYNNQYARTTLVESAPDNPQDTLYEDVHARRHMLGYGIAGTYFPIPSLQLKVSYEKTNRLPESEDLFGDLVNKEANWDVKPESSNNLNLGFAYDTNIKHRHFFRFQASAIYSDVRDYIYYTFFEAQNKIAAYNLERVGNKGVEGEFQYSYRQLFSIGGNMTYQNIRNRQEYIDIGGTLFKSDWNKLRLPNIPYLFGNVNAAVYFDALIEDSDRLSIQYNMQYVHAYYLYWDHVGEKSSKYGIPKQLSHDLQCVYTLQNGKYNLAFEMNNLTDARLYDNYSLQKPGRSFYVKLRYFLKK